MLTRLRSSRLVRVLVRRVGVHRVTAAVALVQAPLLGAVGTLVRRVPRDPRSVVLGSPLDRFADNTAYLYTHLSEQARDGDHALEPVWISGSAEVVRRLRSHGYRAETRWSRGGVLAALRAATFVYGSYRSDINRWLSAGATDVCLWHGLPIKRVEQAIGDEQPAAPPGGLRRRLAEMAHEPPPDRLLTPSDFVASCFAPAFGVPDEHCWRLGYPRDDHLLTDPEKPPAALLWHEREWAALSAAPVVVGLFLTWRDDRVDDDAAGGVVQRLAEVCAARGGLLAYKAHYNVAPTAVPAAGCVQLPGDADLHAYLGLCDVLVTDYSSLAYDFMLMRRPVVYYMPDLEEYGATRGFQVDPWQLPGTLTQDGDALVQAVGRVLDDPAGSPARPGDAAFVRQMWGGYADSAGDACARIGDALAGLAAVSGRTAARRVRRPASRGRRSRRAAG